MKKTQENKNIKVCIIWDKVSDSLITTVIGLNAKACVCNAVYSGIGNRYEYKDMQIYMMGEIDRDSPCMKAYKKPIPIAWDIYKASVSEREALEPLGEEVLKAYDEMQEQKKKQEEKKDETGTSTDNNTDDSDNDNRM